MRTGQIVLLFLAAHAIAALASHKVHAQTAKTCEVVAWPYKQRANEIKIEQLSILSREAVYSYLFFELGQDRIKRSPGLAGKLLEFLRKTELNHDRAMFLEALTVATTGAQVNNVVSQQEICGLYLSTFSAEARTPDSVRTKRSQGVPTKKRPQ